MKKKKFIAVIVPLLMFILLISLVAFIFRGIIFTKLIEKAFLRAGKPITFGAYTILVDKIEGNKLTGIKISEKYKKMEAKSGEYEYIPKENAVKFVLYDGFAEDTDPKNPYAISKLSFKQWNMKVKLKIPF